MKLYLVVNLFDVGSEENCGVFSSISKAQEIIDKLYSKRIGGIMTIYEIEVDNSDHEKLIARYEREGNKKVKVDEEKEYLI